MRARFSATLIFALFGALTVIAMMLVYGVRSSEMRALMMPVSALSVAISGQFFITGITRATGLGAALFGALAMLLAQIPFTAFILAPKAIHGGLADSMNELFGEAATVLILGWMLAGPFQAVTGAFAGLSIRHIVGKRASHEQV